MAARFFIGHAFTDKQKDDLRAAVDRALKRLPTFEIEAIYADEILGVGHILQKIKRLIHSAVFCMFDVTIERANIYYEMGFADGTRKLSFLIAGEGTKVPSDLAGYEILFYRSYSDLEDKLVQNIPKIFGMAAASRSSFVAHKDLVRIVFRSLLREPLSIKQLTTLAANEGFTPEDLERLLNGFSQGSEPLIARAGRKLMIPPRRKPGVDKLLKWAEMTEAELKP
jgi:hypothetical protein